MNKIVELVYIHHSLRTSSNDPALAQNKSLTIYIKL